MLEWSVEATGEVSEDLVYLHTGSYGGEVYALIAAKQRGQAFSQFKGLNDAELYSDNARVSPNL